MVKDLALEKMYGQMAKYAKEFGIIIRLMVREF